MKRLIVTGIILLCIVLTYLFPHAMINAGELLDGHQKIKNNCAACHKPFWGIDQNKCISCHKLSDIGKASSLINSKDKKEKLIFHEHLAQQECTLCHTEHIGKKPDGLSKTFSHDLLPDNVISECSSCHSKPFDKIHKPLSNDCNSCHKTNGWKTDVVFNHEMILLPVAEKNNCVGCHAKATGAMHNQFSTDCSSCHNFKGWKTDVAFNHDKIIGDYKSTCTSCHKAPADDFHSQVSAACLSCHTISAWKPSTFNHDKYFRFDGNHPEKCSNCHTATNFKTYTCYNCHEHSESRIINKHSEHRISNLNDCVRCHRIGSEHESEGGGGKREHGDGGGEGDDD